MAEYSGEPLAEKPGPAPGKAGSSRQQRRRQRSVLQYIAILFAAAFVLLLYTFMMERRQFELRKQQDQASIDTLQQQSVSAAQSLQGLMDENSALQDRVAELEQELNREKAIGQELQNSLDGLTDAHAHLENVHQWTKQALDYFWQIDEAYTRGRYRLCRELIDKLEDPQTDPAAGPLKDYLPAESTTDTGRFSPAERYAEIREKVIK